MTNFDHHPLIFLPSVGVGVILYRWQFPGYISFFVYTFCRVLSFSQKLDMTFQDFHSIQSGHNVTVELLKYGLFRKLSNNFGFIETSVKYRKYTVLRLRADTLFQSQIHLFTRYAQFFHIMSLLSKIVFDSVQNLKGKHVFRKIEIIHVWHIVSSVAQKRNSADFSNSSCKKTMLSNVWSQKSNILRPRKIGIFKT